MTEKRSNNIVIASVFLWLGFVGAISFLESWIKFQAPGVTLSIGLGIGQLVFGALNKVEWFFALVILAALFFGKKSNRFANTTFYFSAFIILIIQTVWLLPALDARALLYITHQPVPSSGLHIYFVVAEVLKVACLIITGIIFLKKYQYD
ncbi:MAG: hypothetical protein JSU03_04325 [Bacteroidetes bacterium]|nr:hypothetical protein [Bacteroidota bacterium]MBS1756481.1 hypothetical protein [Bacteroidota bacterium]